LRPTLFPGNMKKLKKLFLVSAVLFISNLLVAQAFDDGKNLISLGFGFPPTSQITESLTQYQNYNNYNYKNYGTVVLKYEHGLTKYFGVGLDLEYSGANVTYQYNVSRLFNTDTTYKVNVNGTVMGFFIRLNGHYPIGDKLDIFAGLGGGYLLTIDNSTDNNPNNSNNDKKTQTFTFAGQFTIGAHYMVKEHFGLFAEIGWASTIVQAGIVLGF
jgi:hypothetical protein